MANGTPNEVDELIERIRGVNVSDDTAEQPPKVLEEVSVAGIVKHIKKIQSQNESQCMYEHMMLCSSLSCPL